MKKNLLKALSLLLVIATLSLMVSCNFGDILEDIAPDDLGNGVENGASGDVQFTLEATEIETYKETNQYGGEPSFVVGIPDHSIDFEGEEICILYCTENLREWYRDMPADELDEAVALRNNKVEETLNVDISFEGIPYSANSYASYTANFYNLIAADIDVGTHYYDVSANLASPTASPAIRGYTADLLNEELFPYFDFTLPCWNQSIVNDTAINGKLHYVAGDLNLSLFDNTLVIWYNKTLYDQHKDSTDYEDIQQLALDGLWTYDELYRLTLNTFLDLDGLAGPSEHDLYGLSVAQDLNNIVSAPADALRYAWDIEFVSEKNDGSHEFNVAGNVKANEALDKCRALFNSVGTHKTPNAVEYFAQGLSLFCLDELYADDASNNALREMDDMYGLLPLPKYDLNQAQYRTTASDRFSLMFVLDHSLSEGRIKGEAISATLELLTEESYESVRGHYYNRVVKPKAFRTTDVDSTTSTRSIDLFDIIVANITFDICNVYSLQLENINHIWSKSVLSDENTLNSHFAQKKPVFEQALEELDAWFGLK
ncbi:MAG: hypothetical protein E7642_00525 [Ruminococcaceae bacterium]|nr:hypothetical protein [Oscillospiraceae bacterium]